MNDFGPHDDIPIGTEEAGWDEFVDDLQKLTTTPGEELAGMHIAAAAEAVKDAPAARRAGAATPAIPWRRRTVFASLFSSVLGKVLIGSMAMAAATAGVGAAGALPEPVQEFVDDHVFQRSGLQIQERLQIQDQSGNLGEFVDDNQVELQEQARVRQQTQQQSQTHSPNGPGECAEEPCGDRAQTQQQSQTQSPNGPGECTEEPCEDPSQSKTQTQTQTQSQIGSGECAEEPCGDQAQTQSQSQIGSGECAEEPCGDRAQTQQQSQSQSQSQSQIGSGECAEEPCGDRAQTQQQSQTQSQTSPGECTEEPCEDPSQSKAQTQSGKR